MVTSKSPVLGREFPFGDILGKKLYALWDIKRCHALTVSSKPMATYDHHTAVCIFESSNACMSLTSKYVASFEEFVCLAKK